MNLPQETKRNTFLLAITVLFISWGIGYLFLEAQFKASVSDRFDDLFESTQKLFTINLVNERENYTIELEKIVSIDGLSKAVSDKDHNRMDLLLSDYYKNLKKTHPYIKILTFRNLDNVTLYRAHQPEFYGDKLSKKRKLILDTSHLKKSLSGFEVGKLDMTYRITKPIFHQNRYVGNVEIGIDPTLLIKDLKVIFEMEMGVAIDKSLLSIMLYGNNVKVDENYLFLDGSSRLKEYFIQGVEQNPLSFKNDNSLRIKMGIHLKNHLDETLGYLIVGYDTTNIVKKDREFMYKLLFITMLITLLLGIILLKGFDRILNYYTEQAYTDDLTGLKNRAALNSKINSKKDHILILSNIKDFSLINELYGLDIGNKVLVDAAAAFREFAKKNDFDVFRTSADEYVLIKEEEYFDVFECNEKIVDLQKQIDSLNIWVEPLNDSISIEIRSGIAHGNIHVLQEAQMALKMAKERYLPYLAYAQKIDTKKHSEAIMGMRRTIRYAIEHNNVIPFFQPICNREGEVVKYEALVRILEFNMGEKSVIQPGDFLDIAMKSGLYIEIAKKMLTSSLSYFSKRDEKISINLLPKDFLSTHIMEILVDSIKGFKSPQNIVIEITEQEGVEDFERLMKVIKMLKELGVLIAIDDFGSGYANYAHILALKPDYLKIDGSLVRKILTDEDSKILVKNIINFAKDLNIITVAEYIENKEIFELLKEFGVEEYQGYYLGRPIDLINEEK